MFLCEGHEPSQGLTSLYLLPLSELHLFELYLHRINYSNWIIYQVLLEGVQGKMVEKGGQGVEKGFLFWWSRLIKSLPCRKKNINFWEPNNN